MPNDRKKNGRICQCNKNIIEVNSLTSAKPIISLLKNFSKNHEIILKKAKIIAADDKYIQKLSLYVEQNKIDRMKKISCRKSEI